MKACFTLLHPSESKVDAAGESSCSRPAPLKNSREEAGISRDQGEAVDLKKSTRWHSTITHFERKNNKHDINMEKTLILK